jgi:hypothetical protein
MFCVIRSSKSMDLLLCSFCSIYYLFIVYKIIWHLGEICFVITGELLKLLYVKVGIKMYHKQTHGYLSTLSRKNFVRNFKPLKTKLV